MITAHRIHPKNQLEAKQIAALELATLILEEHLGLDVTLQAQRQVGWAGADAWHAGKYCHNSRDEPRLIKINFRNLQGCSTLAVLTVLGHEFRHAVQYQTGLIGQYHQWLGEEQEQTTAAHLHYHDREYSSWFSRPEEIDARRFQSAYANLVLQDPRFHEFKSSLNIEGQTPMKRDLRGTYEAMGFTHLDPRVQTFRTERDSEQSYWLSTEQVGIKKWNKKGYALAWKNFKELMLSQPMKYVMVPVTMDDLVS